MFSTQKDITEKRNLMNKTNFYRVFTFVLLAVLTLGALSGCAAKLPEGFDEAEVFFRWYNFTGIIAKKL